MVPEEYRQSGLEDYPGAGLELGRCSSDAGRRVRLDPTRMTLVCGTAGFDGTQFKGLLAERVRHPDQQDLAQLVLLQSNINNTRSDVAHADPRPG
jgi:arginine decarboxylase